MTLSSNPSARVSVLLESLIDVTRAHPVAHKRLVGTDINYGRELLTALTRETGGWIGWEATNLYTIAEELSFVTLAERGVRTASDIEIGILVNRAFTNLLASRNISSKFTMFERNAGFRRVLRDALLEMRIAGVSVDMVRMKAPQNTSIADLTLILEEYERLLTARKIADPAALFRVALEVFDHEAPFVLDERLFLVPTLMKSGLPGELLQRLLTYGAELLPGDPTVGAEPPTACIAPDLAYPSSSAKVPTPLSWLLSDTIPEYTTDLVDHQAVQIDLFSAATPSEELREVCRRVVAEGIRWDDVEIVTTDPDTYGVTLYALCQQIGIGATMLHGIPLWHTRLGRALERWLSWLEDGLPADVLRQALEAGDLEDPTGSVASTAIARELRAQRIGWGKERYEAVLHRIKSGEASSCIIRREDETDTEFSARQSAREHSLLAMSALLSSLLQAIPEVPQRGASATARTSCGALATATLAWLKLVALHGPAEEHTATRLRTRLQQVADVDDEVVPFSAALATLRDILADVRAWPLLTQEQKPWRTSGGHLHLTDLMHAGASGRRRTFLVGLDANRVNGGITQDPLLPDSVRHLIGSDALPTFGARKARRDYTMACTLASLRGHVTFSYSMSSALDQREAGPSSLLLQAGRLQQRDRSLSFDGLREICGLPVSAIPQCVTAEDKDAVAVTAAALLDARDVWFDALSEGALLLDGDTQVRQAFPMLAAGLSAAEAAQGAELTAFHGVIYDKTLIPDPTHSPHIEFSPSALEQLAKCPLSWLYRYGLSIRPPDDPSYDADRWLDQMQRGALLHEIFERFTREYQGRQCEIATRETYDRMMAIANEIITRWREEIPPPGEAVFLTEVDQLLSSAIAFLEMERSLAKDGDTAEWLHFELPFGVETPGGQYELPDGTTLKIKGRADRVDQLPDNTLRIIDYKTGRTDGLTKSSKKGAFNGGRNLQPALYAAVLQELLGQPVSRFEYRFPTPRGGNAIVTYSAEELQAARATIQDVINHVRSGEFIPTQDKEDCKFCDYHQICRVRSTGFSQKSPRAEWAAEYSAILPSYSGMLTRRGGE